MPLRRYNDIEYINGYIDLMKTEGFLACYNHPYWSLQNYEDYKDLRGLWGMEIYNHGCEHDGCMVLIPSPMMKCFVQGQRIFTVATDDNHNREPFDSPLCDSFGGFVMVKAGSLDYSAVMEALEKGDFYFSMGPEIKEAYIRDNRLVVKTSPVEKIFVIQEGVTAIRSWRP